MTDTHWLCSNESEVGWYMDMFDDSAWSNAQGVWALSLYTDGTLNSNYESGSVAVWHYDDRNTDIYCRGRVYFREYLIKSNSLHQLNDSLTPCT